MRFYIGIACILSGCGAAKFADKSGSGATTKPEISSTSESGPAGPAGPTGPTGPAGADGATGPAGAGDKIASSIFCTAQLENTSLFFDYHAAQMSSGDVFVNGDIKGMAYQITGESYYSSKQTGFASAPIIIDYDVEGAANAGFFTLSLDRSSLVVSIDYTDGDGNKSWAITPDKCVLTKF